MDNVYFSLDNLSVGYNKKVLIHDICVDIKKGEIVTLIGPNGAGKSTILKSITRQLSLLGGKVLFEQNNLHEMSFKEISQKMAVVLTERMKPELMTCADIVATGRYPYTGRLGVLTPEDEQKVDDALAAVNASDLAGRDFNAISDGQRQRIMLARAICQEPEIIILDEPTSFLDIRYKLELLSILTRMAKTNDITIIMTLHEIDLAQKVSDKIVCVHGETIYAYGPPSEIFEEERIRDLYQLDNGFYDPVFGSIELAKAEGEPDVFVLSSGGSGIPVYRALRKENRAFIAGVLYTNDIDYELARLLASEVITAQPFEPLSDEVIAEAKEAIDRCREVLLCALPIGETNRRMQELIGYAKACGKLKETGDGSLSSD